MISGFKYRARARGAFTLIEVVLAIGIAKAYVEQTEPNVAA